MFSCGIPKKYIIKNADAVSGLEIKTYPWYSTVHHNKKKGFHNIHKKHGNHSLPQIIRGHGKIIKPKEKIPVPFVKPDPGELRLPPGKMRVTWLGQSSCLIQAEGRNILTDPVFSRTASPVSFAGPARKTGLPVSPEELPRIDVVVISHNHYDHFDKKSLLKLQKLFNPLFILPLGLRKKALSWGLTFAVELDWWQYLEYKGSRYSCVPAQHFSSRSVTDRDNTLWAGWFIYNIRTDTKLYFAGDTGYFPGFKEIRERLNPPDIALLPIGAYKPRWFMGEIHMDPEEALQACLDLEAGHLIPIHWGTFVMSAEPLSEPPEILRTISAEKGMAPDTIHILPVGGSFSLE